jgi:hypothetical protein
MDSPGGTIVEIVVVSALLVWPSLATNVWTTGKNRHNGQEKACAELKKLVTTAKKSRDRLQAIEFVSDTSFLSEVANDPTQEEIIRTAAARRLDLLKRPAGPSSITGQWKMNSGPESYLLTISQSGDRLEGTIKNEKAGSVTFTLEGTISGGHVHLSSPGASFIYIELNGQVDGYGQMHGTMKEKQKLGGASISTGSTWTARQN